MIEAGTPVLQDERHVFHKLEIRLNDDGHAGSVAMGILSKLPIG